jgi:hypothetical protein
VRRRTVQARIAWVVVSALACLPIAFVAACGDDEPETSSVPAETVRFTKADLPGLVLAPSEAPPGTEADLAGPGFIEKEVDGDEGAGELRRLQRLGMKANYGIEFEPNARDAPFLGTVAILFESAPAADRGFDYLLQRQLSELAPANEIRAEGLGEASFGVDGKFEGEFPTAAFGVRTGNLMQVVTAFSPEGARASVRQARKLAVRVEALAQNRGG